MQLDSGRRAHAISLNRNNNKGAGVELVLQGFFVAMYRYSPDLFVSKEGRLYKWMHRYKGQNALASCTRSITTPLFPA